MLSWQYWQTTRALRRRFAMIAAHAGIPVGSDLSRNLSRSASFRIWRCADLNVVVAVLADYQGLASPFRHDRRPCRHTRRVRPVEEFVEVRELSDMVHLNVSRALADLASVRKESGNQCLGTDRSTWLMVPQDGLLLRAEWYSSVPGNQWFPPTSAFDPRFEAREQHVWGVDFGLVFRSRHD